MTDIMFDVAKISVQLFNEDAQFFTLYPFLIYFQKKINN